MSQAYIYTCKYEINIIIEHLEIVNNVKIIRNDHYYIENSTYYKQKHNLK